MLIKTRRSSKPTRRTPPIPGFFVTGFTLAGLLLTGPAQAAVGAPDASGPAVKQPASREQALVFIREAEAKAQAQALKELEKDLFPFEKEWGIKLLGINRTAAGYMLQFRYKVLDPEKATALVQRKLSPNPYVVVEKSGAKLAVPFTAKLGSLRSSARTPNQIKKGRNYYALFANPGRYVKRGDKITVVFGQFKVEHMTVQ